MATEYGPYNGRLEVQELGTANLVSGGTTYGPYDGRLEVQESIEDASLYNLYNYNGRLGVQATVDHTPITSYNFNGRLQVQRAKTTYVKLYDWHGRLKVQNALGQAVLVGDSYQVESRHSVPDETGSQDWGSDLLKGW